MRVSHYTVKICLQKGHSYHSGLAIFKFFRKDKLQQIQNLYNIISIETMKKTFKVMFKVVLCNGVSQLCFLWTPMDKLNIVILSDESETSQVMDTMNLCWVSWLSRLVKKISPESMSTCMVWILIHTNKYNSIHENSWNFWFCTSQVG